MSQRALAAAVEMRQPAVARIESGRVVPRVDTLERLLRACGAALEIEPVLGTGVDRSQIRELLRLEPSERLRLAAADARALERLERGRPAPLHGGQ